MSLPRLSLSGRRLAAVAAAAACRFFSPMLFSSLDRDGEKRQAERGRNTTAMEVGRQNGVGGLGGMGTIHTQWGHRISTTNNNAWNGCVEYRRGERGGQQVQAAQRRRGELLMQAGACPSPLPPCLPCLPALPSFPKGVLPSPCFSLPPPHCMCVCKNAPMLTSSCCNNVTTAMSCRLPASPHKHVLMIA